MGLIIGEKKLVLEKRLKAIYIQRTADLEKIYVTIRGSKGFFDENNKWNEISEFDVILKDDEILFLMDLTSTKLRTNKLGEMISKAAYGILSGDIPLNCTLKVISNVDGIVKIYKEGTNIYQIPTNTPFELPILVNVTISVESPGYKEYTTTLPVLQGEVTLNVTLEPEEPKEPEEQEESGSDTVNESSEDSESSESGTSPDGGTESEETSP
jgi:hypothetical protein